MVRSSSLLLTLALLGGCVTKGTVRSAPLEAGVQCLYAGPPERIRQATLESLGEASLSVEENVALDSFTWRVLASQDAAGGTARIARVIGEPRESDTLIRIFVESRSRGSGSEASDRGLAQSIHERLARKLGRPAPSPGGPPGTTREVGIEKDYSSELPLCLDALLNVLRERDYRVLEQTRPSADTGAVSARGKGMTLTVTLARAAGNRTRVVAQAEGRGQPENRDEALEVLVLLRKKLLEPLD